MIITVLISIMIIITIMIMIIIAIIVVIIIIPETRKYWVNVQQGIVLSHGVKYPL